MIFCSHIWTQENIFYFSSFLFFFDRSELERTADAAVFWNYFASCLACKTPVQLIGIFKSTPSILFFMYHGIRDFDASKGKEKEEYSQYKVEVLCMILAAISAVE